MSVKVRWTPSADPAVVSYRLESAPAIGGPWSLLANVAHNTSGADYDAEFGVFFYVDGVGNDSTYYRLTAIDSEANESAPSNPFRAAAALPGGAGLVRQLSILVGNVSNLISLGFKTIEVWESVNDGGTWGEITSAVAMPAEVAAHAGPYYNLGGQRLVFKVNGGPETVVEFSSIIQDWTAPLVVQAINQVLPGSATLAGNGFVLHTSTTGRVSTLEIVSSPMSLFTSAPRKTGRDVRPVLVDGVMVYAFYDSSPSSGSRYKWRFSNNGSVPISPFSKTTDGTEAPIIEPDKISIAVQSFIGFDGKPVKRTVLVACDDIRLVDGASVMTTGTKAFDTDENGFIAIPLVRGIKVRIAVEGTHFVRSFVVPNAPSFNLLQTMAEAPDPLSVQETLPFLNRRSL